MSAPLIGSALRDDNGLGDIAYISLFALMFATVGPILIMTAMSMVAHFRCSPHELVVKDVVTVVACPYDPQPLGLAIGAASGGFGVALAALAGYMAATRRPQGSSTTTRIETTSAPAPALPAAQAKPVEVSVVEQAKPIAVDVVDEPKRTTNAKQTAKQRKARAH